MKLLRRQQIFLVNIALEAQVGPELALTCADGILIRDGGESADATLPAKGHTVAEAYIPQTVPMAFSFGDTFDIGEDSASPVGAYQSPFPFTGVIHHIDFDILHDK